MKLVFVVACTVLFAALQAPCVLADEMQEYRSTADQYYQQGNFKKRTKPITNWQKPVIIILNTWFQKYMLTVK